MDRSQCVGDGEDGQKPMRRGEVTHPAVRVKRPSRLDGDVKSTDVFSHRRPMAPPSIPSLRSSQSALQATACRTSAVDISGFLLRALRNSSSVMVPDASASIATKSVRKLSSWSEGAVKARISSVTCGTVVGSTTSATGRVAEEGGERPECQDCQEIRVLSVEALLVRSGQCVRHSPYKVSACLFEVLHARKLLQGTQHPCGARELIGSCAPCRSARW